MYDILVAGVFRFTFGDTVVTLKQKALIRGFELSLKSLGNSISYIKIRDEGLLGFKMYVLILCTCFQSRISKCSIMRDSLWAIPAALGEESYSHRKMQSWKAVFLMLPQKGNAFYKDLVSPDSQL